MSDPTSNPKRSLGRRRFLALAGLVTLGLAAGAIGWRRRQLFTWLARPPIEPTPAGPLPAPARAALLAAAHATFGEPLREDVYADFFAWRAEHVPGMRSLYVGFARHVDREARRTGAREFASAPPATRKRILAALSPRRRWRRLFAGVADRNGLRWSQEVVREMRRLFLRTDAWLRLGYDTIPGEPAGLAGLDAPPRGHA